MHAPVGWLPDSVESCAGSRDQGDRVTRQTKGSTPRYGTGPTALTRHPVASRSSSSCAATASGIPSRQATIAASAGMPAVVATSRSWGVPPVNNARDAKGGQAGDSASSSSSLSSTSSSTCAVRSWSGRPSTCACAAHGSSPCYCSASRTRRGRRRPADSRGKTRTADLAARETRTLPTQAALTPARARWPGRAAGPADPVARTTNLCSGENRATVAPR